MDAIVYGSDLKRYSGRFNLDTKLSNKATFGINLGAGYSKEHLVRQDRNGLNPIDYVYATQPWTYPYEDDGSYHFDSKAMEYGLNIFENVDKNPNYVDVLRATGGSFMEYAFIPELKFRTSIVVDFRQLYQNQYNYPESTLSEILGGGGFRNDAYSQTFSYNWVNNLTYETTIADDHHLTLSAVHEIIQYKYTYLNANTEGMPNSRVDALDVAAGPYGVGGYNSAFGIVSFFLRGAYDYQNKYLLDALIRRDASSRFGPNHRWGTFWSVGLGWNIHEESFLQGNDIISRLKLKASYGPTGNDQIGNYDWRGTFTSASYNGQSSFYQNRLANEDLSWEVNTKLSGGVDFALFDDRITGTMEAYYNKTSDLLLAAQLSRTTGFASRMENVGEMTNKGIEFSVNADIVKTTDWLINAGFSISHNKNTVDKLYNGEPIDTNYGVSIVEGMPLYVYKLTQYAGVNPANGDALYYDKDGKVTNVNDPEACDVYLEDKTPFPTVFGSLNFSVTWKNLDLSGSFYYNYGNWIYNNVAYFNNSDGRYAETKNQDKRLLYDSWKQPGDITDIPRQRVDIGTGAAGTTRFLEDGSYIRLRDITLAYNLPKRIVSKLGAGKIRIYAQAHNLFTITKFTGFDPEIGVNSSWANGNSAYAGTGNDFNYPTSRIYTFGIDLSF
jgi:TonB-linked SusC/RagA family outer membrane protein